MELMPAELEARMPKLFEADEMPEEERILQARYYVPGEPWEWLPVEYNPSEQVFYGFYKIGGYKYWGYFHLKQLVKLGAQLDKNFTPKTFFFYLFSKN